MTTLLSYHSYALKAPRQAKWLCFYCISSLSVNRQIFWNSNSIDNCILGLVKHYSFRKDKPLLRF